MSDSEKKGWSGERRRAERRSGGDRRSRKDPRTGGPAERRVGERRSGKDRRNEAGWQTVAIDPASKRARDEGALIAAAIDARSRARATYSHFQVGAALETFDGDVITGCNIENATYGLTMCAERVAMFKALSEGHRAFVRIAIVADTESPTPPCGACRQILWEFGGDLEIILGNLTQQTGVYRLKDLLPLPFDARLLS